MVGFNQSVSGVFGIMALTFLLVAPSRRLALALGLAALSYLPWLWFYLPSLPFANGHFLPGASFGIIPQASTLLLFLPVLILSLLYTKKMHPWWAVALSLTFLAQIVTAEEALNNVFSRGMRFVSIFTILALAIATEAFVTKAFWDFPRSAKGSFVRHAPKALPVMLGLILSLSIWGNALWFSTFRTLADYYEFVTPNSLQALHWLEENTPTEAKVLAYPEALGWYVGGAGP